MSNFVGLIIIGTLVFVAAGLIIFIIESFKNQIIETKNKKIWDELSRTKGKIKLLGKDYYFGFRQEFYECHTLERFDRGYFSEANGWQSIQEIVDDSILNTCLSDGGKKHSERMIHNYNLITNYLHFGHKKNKMTQHIYCKVKVSALELSLERFLHILDPAFKLVLDEPGYLVMIHSSPNMYSWRSADDFRDGKKTNKKMLIGVDNHC